MILRQHAVQLPDGRTAVIVELGSAGGFRVLVASLGATLLGIDTPDRNGRLDNVLLGSDDLRRYPAAGAPGPESYMGATCGRFANRIAGSIVTANGQRHTLLANEGSNQLHGGPAGFNRALWRTEEIDGGVRMHHRSPDGDQGFPGTLDVCADFVVTTPGELAIRYRATTDRPTHVNIVSHPYFNLSGEAGASILDHELRIDANAYLPIDATAIPTGEHRAVAGTPFDFRRASAIGARIDDADDQLRAGDGYNHCYVLAGAGRGARPVAWLRHPPTGRNLELVTNQPGLQFYSGNALDGSFSSRAGAVSYDRRSGLCLEAQAFPNSPNQPNFPSTQLDPGETYRSETIFRFWVSG